MAKKPTTFCVVCGAVVGPGVRFCCRFCKNVNINDKDLAKHKAKSNKKTTKKKATRKKKKG